MNAILKKIENAKHIVVVSHRDPGADSLGSASAMYTFLLQKHKKVSWFCTTSQIEQRFSFLPWFEKIKTVFPATADLVIALGCASGEGLGIEDIACDLIHIDHRSSQRFASVHLVDTSAVSTTAVIYDFFCRAGQKVNAKTATAIYAGVLDSSEAFLSQNTDGTTFALVKELIDLGADTAVCNAKLRKSLSLAALRLKAAMFRNLAIKCDGKVAVFHVTQEQMRATGAVARDCESPLEEALYLPSVKVSLLLMEKEDLTIKGSLRSNSAVDASRIAALFQGRGDRCRAEFSMESLDENLSLLTIEKRVIKLLKKEL